jgi:NAD(P)-dependent dehydrogenase (short-subunit alcohol dehydrogenase family)
MSASVVVLVAGATSGIGRATALYLARKGHRVFATGRRAAALETLAREAAGTKLETLPLDVTSPESIRAAQAEVDLRTNGYGLDALVNNAGYAELGPLEELSDERLRAQFNTNVFGLMGVTRAFVAQMRQRRSGRIVNVSSIGGRVTFPMVGAYHAAKYAVEALSDALRVELRAFGVRVVIIEPGSIDTEFSDVAMQSVVVDQHSPYASALRAVNDTWARFAPSSSLEAMGSTPGGATNEAKARFAPRAVGPEGVARVIETAITCARPAARYVRPLGTYLLLILARLLPTLWFDGVLARMMGLTVSQRG